MKVFFYEESLSLEYGLWLSTIYSNCFFIMFCELNSKLLGMNRVSWRLVVSPSNSCSSVYMCWFKAWWVRRGTTFYCGAGSVHCYAVGSVRFCWLCFWIAIKSLVPFAWILLDCCCLNDYFLVLSGVSALSYCAFKIDSWDYCCSEFILKEFANYWISVSSFAEWLRDWD